MATVLCVNSDKEAPGSYRVIEPYSSIESDIKFIVSNNLDHAWIDDHKMVDAVLIQRSTDPLVLRFIKEFKAEGGITVFETDDDIDNIPRSSPYYKGEGREFYRECIKECDYLHVSTPELATGDKSVVFPNGINLKKYVNPLPKIPQSVGWQGSASHIESLQLIKPVIEELLNNDVKVVLTSNRQWLDKIFKPHKNLIIEDWVPFELSHKLSSQCDVYLTPLPDNKFNRSKSEIKVLEAAAWKMPCVSSDVAPYRRFNELSNGGNVLVKKEKTKYWLDAIYCLLNDKQRYRQCADKSYICVKEKYNLEIINKQRSEFWKRVLS